MSREAFWSQPNGRSWWPQYPEGYCANLQPYPFLPGPRLVPALTESLPPPQELPRLA